MIGKKSEIKRSTKDSVFCNLFSYAKYQLMLYKVLRPEDMETTEADISTVTLETVLINTLYNDLGMMVHGGLLILVEAQSSWLINILARIVMCFAGEWKKYIQNTDQSVYSSMRVRFRSLSSMSYIRVVTRR